MTGHVKIIGLTHDVLCLAVNIVLGPGFFGQNISAYGLGALTPECSPVGYIDSQPQNAMIQTYHIPSFYLIAIIYICRHFSDDTFKRIFFNENVSISIKISLNFVPKGPINNISVLVQKTAWRRPGDKPLSEPVMVCLPTHICVTRPQWLTLVKVIFQCHVYTLYVFAIAKCICMTHYVV